MRLVTPSYSVLSRLIPVKMPLISLSEDAVRLSKVSCNILLGSDIFLLYASFYVSFFIFFFLCEHIHDSGDPRDLRNFCFNFCKFRKQFKKTFRPSLELICTISGSLLRDSRHGLDQDKIIKKEKAGDSPTEIHAYTHRQVPVQAAYGHFSVKPSWW